MSSFKVVGFRSLELRNLANLKLLAFVITAFSLVVSNFLSAPSVPSLCLGACFFKFHLVRDAN